MYRQLIVPALLLLFLVSCENNRREVNFNGEYLLFEGNGYSLEYPETWILSTDITAPGLDATIRSPKEYTTDDFLENFNILIQEIGDVTIDDYINISEQQIKTMIPDGHLILSDKKKVNGRVVVNLIYTGTFSGKSLKCHQYCAIISPNAYVLTFTSDENRYDDYADISERVLSSFKLND